MDRQAVADLGTHEASGALMTKTNRVSLDSLPRISGETLDLMKMSATKCLDCAVILKYLLVGDRVGPALRKDGSKFSVQEQTRHILELKGVALKEAGVERLRALAGTCREPAGSGCFYCARILDAMTEDGLLRDWPQDSKEEQTKITVDDQRAHILLECGEPIIWEEVPA